MPLDWSLLYVSYYHYIFCIVRVVSRRERVAYPFRVYRYCFVTELICRIACLFIEYDVVANMQSSAFKPVVQHVLF